MTIIPWSFFQRHNLHDTFISRKSISKGLRDVVEIIQEDREYSSNTTFIRSLASKVTFDHHNVNILLDLVLPKDHMIQGVH
jgi:hypothetical protein